MTQNHPEKSRKYIRAIERAEMNVVLYASQKPNLQKKTHTKTKMRQRKQKGKYNSKQHGPYVTN